MFGSCQNIYGSRADRSNAASRPPAIAQGDVRRPNIFITVLYVKNRENSEQSFLSPGVTSSLEGRTTGSGERREAASAVKCLKYDEFPRHELERRDGEAKHIRLTYLPESHYTLITFIYARTALLTRWCAEYTPGKTSTEDGSHSGGPTTVVTQEIVLSRSSCHGAFYSRRKETFDWFAVVMAAIRDAGREVFAHTPCSPNLAPNDFYLFLRLKEYLKGLIFKDDKAVVAAVQEFLGVNCCLAINRSANLYLRISQFRILNAMKDIRSIGHGCLLIKQAAHGCSHLLWWAREPVTQRISSSMGHTAP
ncbi:hypothetical protein EVAR_52092_1 [Eumeta japonica]|uniref:Uncharacterized protein n=1 Tax=Eumeta variegata TaxID=151549 RepID=A0A4C1Y3P9_EUMVA|nr:hypothetical protein EVAR_52092_1 [Eumeta japonica]